ncbi:hypothetical protein NCC49_005575 [Naganishia albida]|nr:hypothetical protein NCC49_005575 [Naganishia albida]
MPDLESACPRPPWAWASYATRLLTSRTQFQRRLKLVLLGCTAFLCLGYLLTPSYRATPFAAGGEAWWDPRYWDVPFTPRRQRIQKTLDRYRLAPDDPFPNQLPPGNTILPDVQTASLPRPRSHRSFPPELLHTLYPSSPPETPVQEHIVNPHTPVHPYIKNWTSPAWFRTDGAGGQAMPRVQADFSGKVRVGEQRRKVNAERAEAVKRAFVYAWQRYKDKAWGHDEVRPVTGVPSDPFQGWGATIIDSLETLLIMGLADEYEACREHVWRVDFRLISGNDWARGWRADLPFRDDQEEAEAAAGDWRRAYLDEYADERERPGRQSHQLMATFETGIRYLGGLVGAYDLSGDEIVLERAKELGKILGRGFDTTSGLLLARFDAGSKSEWFHNGRVSLAEVGSMTLELTRLSQVTGDRWYFDRAQRAIDYIQHVIVPASTLGPLVPAMFDSAPVEGHVLNGYYTFGAMADSYYEYLIKQHQLVGGATRQFAQMYAAAVDKAREVLYADLPFFKGRGMMTISGRHHPGRGLQYDLEHLSCFAGGMLGLGARLLDRPDDLEVGQAFTRTCYHLGASTPSGLQPEIVNFLRPDLPREQFYENITAIVEDGEDEYITVNKLKGIPQGTSGADGRYLGRPETAESVFYMYRLTGDPKWQDRGWRMFTAWIDKCTAEFGISSVGDVRQKNPKHTDNMESFVFAETFKYYYLLHAPPDLISLDDYVFTTEAHPILLRNRKPGADKFWTPSAQARTADLGVRGSGTDAQLFMRRQRIDEAEKQRQGAPPGSKGVVGAGLGRFSGSKKKPEPLPPGIPPRMPLEEELEPLE